MKKLIWFALGITGLYHVHAQDGSATYRNFPVIISLQFHSLNMPFRNITSCFSNVGIGIGTEVSYGGKDRWLQQFELTWYRNKNAGNGLLLYTQTVWRPEIASNFYGEIKLGAGFLMAQRPTASFKHTTDGWSEAGHKGKGMLTILSGIGAGYEKRSGGLYTSPFLNYQFLVSAGYNKSVPIMPQTMIQAGARIHPE